MWDKSLLTSFGGNSKRRIFTYVMSALVAAFLWVALVTSTPTNAVTTSTTSPSTSTPGATSPAASTAPKTDATWQNGSILYNNMTFTGPKTADGSTDPKLPTGTQYYINSTGSGLSANGNAYVIYFSTGVDPGSAKTAQYIVYSINGFDGSFSQVGKTKTITINPNATASSSDNSSTDAGSSCTVPGIGWVVCPVSNFLASGMDTVFDILKGFLIVQPLGLNQNGTTLYQSWNYIRSFANVAFVIVFMIIIYSQITNMGITNYGIKKLLPRLIIAAILVNVSYYICAIAIDLSNVIGVSLENLLIIMRQHLQGAGSTGVQVPTWTNVTGFVLTGGTAAAAGAVGVAGLVATTGGSAEAAIILLLPMLLGLLLAVLVALIVLAARQAVLTLLVIVAPIAFVAYLLPNTEKWFERWRKLLTDLLVFFPIFALIFGGSQLAASLIIQTAGGSINVILLAMFVQVAPLIVTPLLIRFSGEIVSKIAGVVNNPRKGILDRTRNWAKERSSEAAARNMARTDPVRPNQIFRRYALDHDQIRRRREGLKKAHESVADARWANSQSYSDINQQQRFADESKQQGEQLSELRYGQSKNVAGAVRNLDMQMRDTKVNIETAHAQTEANWEGSHQQDRVESRLALRGANDNLARIKSQHDRDWEEIKYGRTPHGVRDTAAVRRIIQQAQDDTEQVSINAMATARAKRVGLSEYGRTLQSDPIKLVQAAGIDPQGQTAILADIKSQIEAEKDTLVKNIKIATDIQPGDIEGLTREFRRAVAEHNAEGVRAYADLFTEAANPGVTAFRKVLHEQEAAMVAMPDVMADFKAHVNSSAAINAAAEDIATWSRDSRHRTLETVTKDVDTWASLTANQFASEKKSTQEAALFAKAITPATANAILTGPAFQNLKPDIQARIQKLADNDATYGDGLVDPFLSTEDAEDE